MIQPTAQVAEMAIRKKYSPKTFLGQIMQGQALVYLVIDNNLTAAL